MDTSTRTEESSEFSRQRNPASLVLGYLRKPYDLVIWILRLRRAQDSLDRQQGELEAERLRLSELQAEFSELEQQYQVLENTLQDTLWISGEDDRFLFLSPAVYSMFGFDIDEMIGRTFFDLVSKRVPKDKIEEISRCFIALRENKERGDSKAFEVPMRRKDGSEFWAEVNCACIFEADGVLKGISGVTRDISRRKQAESDNQVLEQELSRSRHMESIGQLAGGIAHDFNNMLTTVLGFTDLARGIIPDNHEIEPYLTEISRAGTRASDLVKQLLTFSKQKPIEPIPVNVNDIVSKLDPMIRRLVAENIEVSIDLQALPNILADPSEIERVIINLCINSSDAMPEGGLLRISTREYLLGRDNKKAIESGTDSFACITVSDTGEGIDPKIRHKVLEPFFSTKPFGQGTGLGLAVTYSIVQQHNGFLDIASQPGVGTTIKVLIPKTILSLVESRVDESVLREKHSGTILVVEDQDQVRELIVQILKESGFDVMVAGDGEQAVAIYENDWPEIDLVLMDIVMPRMGGRDAMHLMRRANPGAEVLFMTGYSGEDPRINLVDHSRNKILRKPFSAKDVVSRVSEIIEAV